MPPPPSTFISDRMLKKLRAQPPSTRQDIADGTLQGFSAIVFPSGRISFAIRYRLNGKRQRRIVGHYPTTTLHNARDRAGKLLAQIDQGTDPSAPPRHTFEQLCASYVERWARPRKKSWREDQRMIARDLLPVFGPRDPHSIKRSELRELLDTITLRGPIAANRTWALIKKIYRWANEVDLVEHDPTAGIRRPNKERAGERVLDGAELRDLYRYLDGVSAELVPERVVQVRLLLGQRTSEITAARQKQLREISGGMWWELPGAITKSGRPHLVYLHPAAYDVMTRGGPGKVLHPNTLGTGNARIMSKETKRIREKSGVDFVPGDLRRTFISTLFSFGIDELTVKSCVNHKRGDVTAINYDRWQRLPEKAEAFTRFAEHVLELAAGGKGHAPVFATH